MSLKQEFKDFIMRGNVIDLAVGMVIGTAFSGIVKSLVDDVIMPPIGLLLGGVDFSNLFITLKDGVPAPEAGYASLAAAKAADQADGHGDGGRGEDEFNQGREAGDKPAGRAKGAVGVGKRPARMRNGGGQLGKAKNKGAVHRSDGQRDDHKAQRPGLGPAVAPAKILPGNNQPNGDPP